MSSGVASLAGPGGLLAEFGCCHSHYYLNFQCISVLWWLDFISSCLYWSPSIRGNKERGWARLGHHQGFSLPVVDVFAAGTDKKGPLSAESSHSAWPVSQP